MSDRTVRGRCLCGRVRVELDEPTRFVAHCHCENCRRAHGAAFVTFAGVPAAQFRVVSGGEDLTAYRSETDATRRFCRHCGSTLTFESPRWAGEVHVAVANLLDPLDRAPGAHAHADRAPEWCPIADDLPRYGGESGTEEL